MTDILNNETNLPKPDPNKDIRGEAYDLVDKALEYLSKNDGEWLPGIFDIYTTAGQIAKDILINNSFITLRGYNIDDTTVDITESGLTIVELGGYRIFLSAKNKSIEYSIEKDNLEIQQLRTNNVLLTNQLVDYEKTKSNLKKTTTATIVLSVIALIELILLLKAAKLF